MENKKNRPAFRGRDAAMLGGIAGGLYGASIPAIVDPGIINEAVSQSVYHNPNIPAYLEEPTVMMAGGSATVGGAALGALGGAAAYQLMKGLGKGAVAAGKGIGRGIKKLSEKKASKDK